MLYAISTRINVALLNTTANTEGAVSSTNKYTSYNNEITNNILWGNVPVKALGLPNDFLYDSRGKVIEYVVHSSLVEGINVANKTYNKKGYISNNNAYNIHYENSSGTKYYYNPAGISIVDEKSNTTITPNIAYALISKQGSDKCYNNKKSSNTTAPSDSTKYNCNKFYSNSAITLHQGYSKSFDNIVSYITLDELVVSMAKIKNQLTEMRQGRVLEYQNKYDNDLTTTKKDIVGAVNENVSSINVLRNTKEPLLPSGTMILFYKPQNQIPAGWQICDGTNGTPDMRGRVVIGVGSNGTTNYTLLQSGGVEKTTLSGTITRTKNVSVSINGTYLSISQMPAHCHSGYTGFAGNHRHASPFVEHTNADHNPFGAIMKVYDRSNNKYVEVSRARKGYATNQDNDNSLLLTSMPVTFDEGFNTRTVYSEIYNTDPGNDNIYVNGFALQTTDDYGNHRHSISCEGGDSSHNHSASIVQPEFSLSLNNSTIDNRQPYRVVYYICKK